LPGPGAVWRRLDPGVDADMNDDDEQWHDWCRSNQKYRSFSGKSVMKQTVEGIVCWSAGAQ
jgi:hypothetical protein